MSNEYRIVNGYLAGRRDKDKEITIQCKKSESLFWHHINKFLDNGENERANNLFDKCVDSLC